MNYYAMEALVRQQQREIEHNARHAWKHEREIVQQGNKEQENTVLNCCPANVCCAA